MTLEGDVSAVPEHPPGRRNRRRAATIAVVAVLVTVVGVAGAVAVAGGMIKRQSWQRLSHSLRSSDEIKPAKPGPGQEWRLLDDGTPRGALGNDDQLRQDVLTVLEQPNQSGLPAGWQLTRPDTLHVLWADRRGGRRLSVVSVVMTSDPAHGQIVDQQAYIWLGPVTVGAPMTVLQEGVNGPAITGFSYDDSRGRKRLLAVVRRTATVTTARTVISPTGRIQRSWRPVVVKDGVLDIPDDDPLGRGPLTLRARVGTGKSATLSTLNLGSASLGGRESPVITPSERDAALRNRRGPAATTVRQENVDVLSGGIGQGLNDLIAEFGSDAAHTSPRVEWAGDVPPIRGGGILHAISGGLPGQGRLLEIELLSGKGAHEWRYQVPVPAGKLPKALAWRVPTPFGTPKPSGQVVGWLFDPAVTSVDVTVDGAKQPAETEDGLGWLEVAPAAEVIVTARGLPGGLMRLRLHPADVAPNRPIGSSLLD